MWAVLSGLLAIIAAVLKLYVERKEGRTKTDEEERMEEFENALANDDTDTLSRMFREYSVPESGDNPCGQADKEASKREL